MSTAPNTCIELERACKIEQEYARQLLEIGDSPVLRLGMADILMEQLLITEKKFLPTPGRENNKRVAPRLGPETIVLVSELLKIIEFSLSRPRGSEEAEK